MSNRSGQGLGPRVAAVVTALLLSAHAIVGIDTVRRQLVTHGEFRHLPINVRNWRTGPFDIDPSISLLRPLSAAWPLRFTPARAVPMTGERGEGRGPQFPHETPHERGSVFWLGRYAGVGFSVLTAFLIALWVRELAGPLAATLAVLCWTASSTVLANATLVTPEIGLTCLFFATLYTCWRYCRRPTLLRAALWGVLLGAAQLTGFTAVLLIPLCVIVWFLARHRRSVPLRPVRLLGQWTVALGLALLMSNAGYLFQKTGTRLVDSFPRFESRPAGTSRLRELLRRHTGSQSSVVPAICRHRATY